MVIASATDPATRVQISAVAILRKVMVWPYPASPDQEQLLDVGKSSSCNSLLLPHDLDNASLRGRKRKNALYCSPPRLRVSSRLKNESFSSLIRLAPSNPLGLVQDSPL